MEGTMSGSLPDTRHSAQQARNVFVTALTISAILAFNLTILGARSAGLAACFVPLLFWSLVAAAYAFHSLARDHALLTEQLGSRLVWERMRGLRQLAAIKERLRERRAPDPE